MGTRPPRTIDEYIAASAPETQPILERIRATIHKAAPKAEEAFSYQMPAFTQNGYLIYFAAFKNHIGLFPPVRGDEKIVKEASVYAGPKGNLRFPLNQRIPYGLIGRIAKLRVKQNLERAAVRAKKKK